MNAAWCPQCGPRVAVDEDGCCSTCGATATGDGANAALAAEQRAAEAEGLLLRVKSESASPTDLWHEIAALLSKQPTPEVKQAAKPEGGE